MLIDTTPGVLDGSIPWYTAFSSKGCSTSGGTSASPGMLLRCHSTCRRSVSRSLLEGEILTAELDLVGERHEFAVVAHQDAKEIGHVEQRGFRLFRVGAHERQHRVDAVEQEMRANPGLKRLQPRLGDRRRQRLRAQAEIAEQHAEISSANAMCRSSAQRRMRQLPREERVHADADEDRQCRRPAARRSCWVCRASHGAIA